MAEWTVTKMETTPSNGGISPMNRFGIYCHSSSLFPDVFSNSLFFLYFLWTSWIHRSFPWNPWSFHLKPWNFPQFFQLFFRVFPIFSIFSMVFSMEFPSQTMEFPWFFPTVFLPSAASEGSAARRWARVGMDASSCTKGPQQLVALLPGRWIMGTSSRRKIIGKTMGKTMIHEVHIYIYI